MRDVVVHIMHWNCCAGRRRVRYFALRASIPKTLATTGVDAYGTGRAGVGSAAGAFDGELPVCVV